MMQSRPFPLPYIWLPPSTWAAKPAASAVVAGTRQTMTDVGPVLTGSDWVADGVSSVGGWKPVNGILMLAGGGAGWILPGLSANSNVSLTANVATVVNGAPTAHNIPATTYNGCNVYFAGSSNIPAGWYPTFNRTSTTAYTFAYTHADVGSESVNGAAAYTSQTTVTSDLLPAYAMGLSGSVEYQVTSANNNSAGAKTLKYNFGGQGIHTTTQTTTTFSRLVAQIVQNNNSYTNQFLENNNGPSQTSVNTAVDVNLVQTMQVAVATDWLALCIYSIDLRNK